MKLWDIIPLLTIRSVALDTESRDGERVCRRIDLGNKKNRETLYRYRDWEIQDISACVQQMQGALEPVMVISLAEFKRSDDNPERRVVHNADSRERPAGP